MSARMTGTLRAAMLRSIPLVLFLGSTAAADHTPACNGYNPETRSWGDANVDRHDPAFCPRNAAFMAVEYARDPGQDGEAVRVNGTCCSLPPNALLESFSFSGTICPEDSIATGVRLRAGVRGQRAYELRCSRINSELYRLSEPVRVRRLVFFHQLFDGFLAILFGSDEPITRSELPLWLRYGALRTGFASWSEGCIGFPFGSVLTGKRRKSCDGLEFRELVPVTEDAPRVLPECAAVGDPFETTTLCERGPETALRR